MGSYDGRDADAYATICDGLIDSRLKDAVLVAPGEVIRIARPFKDYEGRVSPP